MVDLQGRVEYQLAPLQALVLAPRRKDLGPGESLEFSRRIGFGSRFFFWVSSIRTTNDPWEVSSRIGGWVAGCPFQGFTSTLVFSNPNHQSKLQVFRYLLSRWLGSMAKTFRSLGESFGSESRVSFFEHCLCQVALSLVVWIGGLDLHVNF